MTYRGRLCGAVILAVGMAAVVLPEEEYKRPPVQVNCKTYGHYAHCRALNADDLVELAWIYTTEPQYIALGNTASGPIKITDKQCKLILFYGTDPVDWRTHMASVNIRLEDGRATFKGCEQKNVQPE